jgi:hypothetical protein
VTIVMVWSGMDVYEVQRQPFRNVLMRLQKFSMFYLGNPLTLRYHSLKLKALSFRKELKFRTISMWK